jgi:hypothetical protein
MGVASFFAFSCRIENGKKDITDSPPERPNK